jgi:hypothetical protein
MTSVAHDVRYSLRLLLKQKGFTVVCVLNRGLGIWIKKANFSVVDTFVFGWLP